MFGVVFPDRSFPVDMSSFTQIDQLHYLLDLSSLISSSGVGDPRLITDLCIFLLPTAATSLPSTKALAVYLQPPSSSSFLFCGAVHLSRPSALLTLPWPDPSDADPSAPASSPKIGVSVEDIAALPPVVDAGTEKRIERMALKVGESLFNFMQSFCGVDGSRLVVPMDILDRWFNKFQERAKKDPSYLKGFAA